VLAERKNFYFTKVKHCQLRELRLNSKAVASGSLMILSNEQKQQFINDGYVVVRGLLPPDLVERTRDDVLRDMGLELTNAATWDQSKATGWAQGPLTKGCRTPAVEQVAAELAGPDQIPGVSYHYGKRLVGLEPYEEGYIPVLSFPKPGEAGQIVPTGFHIDGYMGTYLWPNLISLVMLAYLTDTAEDGGATLVRPGSHRQIFEYGLRHGLHELHGYPELPYAGAVPIAGKAGDVIFFHYLLVHSGSENRSGHIRVGLNTPSTPHPDRPYQPRSGAPDESWTPLDYTLRTDTHPGAAFTPHILPLQQAMDLLDK
jgi:hypothetical protein